MRTPVIAAVRLVAGASDSIKMIGQHQTRQQTRPIFISSPHWAVIHCLRLRNVSALVATDRLTQAVAQ